MSKNFVKPIFFKTRNDNWYMYDNSTRIILPINEKEKMQMKVVIDNDEWNTDVLKKAEFEEMGKKIQKYGLFVKNHSGGEEKEIIENVEAGLNSFREIMETINGDES